MVGSNMIRKYAKTCKNISAILSRHPFVFVATLLHKPQGKALKARCSEGMHLQILCLYAVNMYGKCIWSFYAVLCSQLSPFDVGE